MHIILLLHIEASSSNCCSWHRIVHRHSVEPVNTLAGCLLFSNKVTHSKILPECLDDIALVNVVVLPKNRLDCLSSLLQSNIKTHIHVTV